MNEFNFFVLIVAGENPDELIKLYDKNLKVAKHIVYRYEDAEYLKNLYLTMYENIINSKIANKDEIEFAQESYDDIKSKSTDDFYYELTCDYELDENRNAVSEENINGKYSFYKKGNRFSIPFLTKEGNEVFQARKKDVDWGKMHLYGGEVYEKAWDLVMNGVKPKNDYEKNIYENMKDKVSYFKRFETKENYVIHSTAFWSYAFLDENGWCDMDDVSNQFVWVNNFYDTFIKPLNDNTLLTIYECKK